MKKTTLFIIILLSALPPGCLDFGKDEETQTPTAAQVARCRSVMYLNPDLKIGPLGFKLRGSGIDDAIWFKFKAKASEVAEVFDTAVVDVSEFKQGFTMLSVKGLKWWDVKGKTFLGGEVSLPNVKFMKAGITKTADGFLVYIMWHEV